MGDFLPPLPGHAAAASSTAAAAAAEHERLRRRFDRYRQLHASRQQQYDSFASGVYNQQAHETQLLHRRWQDSKKPTTTASSAAAKCAGSSARMPGAAARAGDALTGSAGPTTAGNAATVCRPTV